MSKIPSESEVLGYFNSLSNWGRWGYEDQKGTLNFLTRDITKNALSLVESGETVSCARPLVFEPTVDATGPAVHYMVESGEGWASGDKVTSRVTQAATDYIGMVFHGYTVTHVDSLAHFFWEGQMYNGQPAHLVSTNLGATAESIEVAGKGIVSKGILVDVPRLRGIEWLERGEGVMPDDILAAEENYGFKIGEVVWIDPKSRLIQNMSDQLIKNINPIIALQGIKNGQRNRKSTNNRCHRVCC